MNYNNKYFKPVQTSINGETTDETIFHYKQSGSTITANYQGGTILKGHLIGIVDSEGHISMRYHQVNTKGELMTGVCESTPEELSNGKIRLHEEWKWTSGDCSHGKSILEEI
ncbi:n-acetylglutamate synthase [Maribacter arcticus]|uniref:n-acetylglutamate synthase n=1 Tax=Maribacter arcticus TaxID=561365 RepID=UPI0030017264